MRRFLIMIFILLLPGICLSLSMWMTQPEIIPTITYPVSTPSPVPSTPSASITPTSTHTPSPTSTQSPVTTTSGTPSSFADSFTVQYHPDDRLYVGDLVSIEVISPAGGIAKTADLQIQVDPPNGPTLGPAQFSPWGIQGREQATLLWAWDTRDQDPGTHTLAFSVQPKGIGWSEQVTLLPSSNMPPAFTSASWASTQTQCCTVFYLTNTASERDLSTLTNLIDEQARFSTEMMGVEFTQPITITILPRLLGHGGFASNEISVSYLDRNYAATAWEMVVRHEMIHTLDGQLGGDFRPNIFVEGLAVYMSGGHYQPEPFMVRAATLLEEYLGWYIPLSSLTDDFYASQHEIGYLEGAALIEYMVKTYGWEAFSNFYRGIHLNQGESQSAAIDAALKAHFSISFSQIEQEFIAALYQQPDISTWVDDVRLSVTYFDTLRSYQQLLDPSAYFRTAWLMVNQVMRERLIVADYLRHPDTTQNIALEALFITTSNQMEVKQYTSASDTLEVINAILDGIEQGAWQPFSASSLAADYFSITSLLQQQGYEAQRIEIDENNSVVYVTNTTEPYLVELNLTRLEGKWSLLH